MQFRDLFTTLQKSNYYIFSYEEILAFFPREKRENLKRMIYRWAEKNWICSLKRGLYELIYPKDLNIPDLYVANKLYTPSYVSLETALSYYSLIPEVSMAVVSISTKATRRFKNKHGLFLYHTVKPECFTGYYIEQQRGFSFLIAEPEKALADYIYFKSYRRKKFSFRDERFDRKAVRRLKKDKVLTYAGLYGIDGGYPWDSADLRDASRRCSGVSAANRFVSACTNLFIG